MTADSARTRIDPGHALLFAHLAQAYWTGAEIERETLGRWMTDAGVFYEAAVREPCGADCYCAANYELPTICCALSQRVVAMLQADWSEGKR
jgi:hypothetical protein